MCYHTCIRPDSPTCFFLVAFPEYCIFCTMYSITVLLPCDHGLDFFTSAYVRIQSINQSINRCVCCHCIKEKSERIYILSIPQSGGKMSKRLGGIMGCKYKTSSWQFKRVRLCSMLRRSRCVVCFLPVHSGHQVRWTYQPGSHRIFHPPSFCGACLNFSREKDSAIPFPRRT